MENEKSYDPKKLEYNLKYKAENMKRIPLDVKKEWYDTVLKPAADAAGEPVNTFIKKAVMYRINKQ